MIKMMTVGEKVFKGSGGWAYTITLIDGENAVLDGKTIAKLSELKPVVTKNSDGWYTLDTKPGMVYYVKWGADEKPTFLFELALSTQTITVNPKPFGYVTGATVLPAGDFTPVRLTTTANLAVVTQQTYRW